MTTPNVNKDMIQLKLVFIADGDAKWYNYFERQFGCPYRNKGILIYNSAIMFLGIYPNNFKTYVYT